MVYDHDCKQELMAAPLAENSLAACADPVFIITDKGALAWANEAFKRVSGKRAPSEVFGAESLRKFCSTSHYACYDTAFSSADGKSISQSAIVLDIGSGDPDSSLLLVTLKSTGTEHSRIAAKEESLATVAHDLRNPLSAIFSYADALVDTAAGEGMQPAQKQIMKRIRSTASRCVELVLNYQMLAKMQSRGFLRPNVPVDLNEVTRSVVEHAWREDANSPTLTSDLSTAALPVYMERVQVERALANLVSNALKYTPAGGRVLVKTTDAGTASIVSVNNTGVQLSESELKTLFDRYSRAKSSEGIGGSGLGLFIVKSLMEAGGGSVEAKSDAHDGVTVTLKFPRTL